MDKMTIVLISLLLGAIMLMGSGDYLSSTYLSASANSYAQKWISEAGQIALAARQSGTLSIATDNWQQGNTTAATLSALSNYLSDLPRHNGKYVFWPCNVSAGNTSCPVYVTDTTHATDATLIEAQVENLKVCQAIQKLANRGNVTPPTTTASTGLTINYAILAHSNQQFACVNANAGTAQGYYFLYRVFMDHGT